MADTRYSREDLVLRHDNLVFHIARQIMRTTRTWELTFDDLTAAGMEGLKVAGDTFDPDRGLAFSIFAAPRIRGAILERVRTARRPPEPGAPQQDGPTSQPSAPAEGASGDRGSP